MLKRFNKIVFLFILMSVVSFAKMVKIDIITLNDFHGNVTEHSKELGMAKLVGYVNQVKEENPNTLIVSAGDNYQGTAMSNLTYGEPVTDMFKAMKLTASAIGNHEFDWGADKIAAWAKDGKFDYLASNIYDKTTGEPVSWAKPYKMVEVDGVKIVFIGLATEETPYKTKVEFVENLEFKKSDEAAKLWVDYLKSGKAEEGTPDVIIALTHIPGFQDRETKAISGEELKRVSKVDGIDAIITGHSHQTIAGKLNGVPVIQAYKSGRALGRLVVMFDTEGGKEITVSVDMAYKHKDNISEDSATKKLYMTNEEKLQPILGKVIGKLNKKMTHDRDDKNLSELGYWSSDVMRKAVNVQIGLQNGGGLRRSLEAGNITMGDMYEVMPFDNQLVTMKVTGAHLRELIDHGIEADYMTDGQFAGLLVAYDPSKPYEKRVVRIYLEDGTPVKDNEYYTLVTNDFMLGGGDKYDFKAAQNIVDTYVPIRDALVKAIEAKETVQVPDIEGIMIEVEKYQIKKGDILGRIANKYEITVADLAEFNNIPNPNLIYADAYLYVPAN